MESGTGNDCNICGEIEDLDAFIYFSIERSCSIFSELAIIHRRYYCSKYRLRTCINT